MMNVDGSYSWITTRGGSDLFTEASKGPTDELRDFSLFLSFGRLKKWKMIEPFVKCVFISWCQLGTRYQDDNNPHTTKSTSSPLLCFSLGWRDSCHHFFGASTKKTCPTLGSVLRDQYMHQPKLHARSLRANPSKSTSNICYLFDSPKNGFHLLTPVFSSKSWATLSG